MLATYVFANYSNAKSHWVFKYYLLLFYKQNTASVNALLSRFGAANCFKCKALWMVCVEIHCEWHQKEEDTYTHLYAWEFKQNKIRKLIINLFAIIERLSDLHEMAVQFVHNNHNWPVNPQGPPQEEVEVYVLFVNTTNRTLDLYWVREPDMENIQLTLKPNEEVRVNTYNTHIWFFRDYYTGERMHVRSKRLFFPVRVRVPRNPQRPDELCDVRSQVLIHFPLRTLKDNCLWLIARWLKRTKDTPRDFVNGYPIPVTLKQQLHLLLDTMEVYCSQAPLRRMRVIDRR